MLSKSLSVMRSATRALTWIVGALLIANALVISLDVVMRKLTAVSIPGTDEMAGYVFAIGTAVAFSFALLERANVRVDALHAAMPGRIRALVDLVGVLSLGLFAFVLAWRASLLVEDSWRFGARSITPLNTPLVIPQLVWLVALVFYCVNIALVGVAALRCVFRTTASDLIEGAQDLSVRESAL